MSRQESFKDTPMGMIMVLTTASVVVGALLAGFFHLVEPRIEANRLAEEKRAIFSVLEGVVDYEVVDTEVEIDGALKNVRIFRGIDETGATTGYAFLAKGPGFQGIISMMVGLRPDLEKLSGMKVIDQIETPGLGNKIAAEPFELQFRALSVRPEIEYIKNRRPEKPNQIQAITGATISSKAVVKIINKKMQDVIKAIGLMEAPVKGGGAGGGVESPKAGAGKIESGVADGK